MDALEYMSGSITEQSVTCDVLRKSADGAYETDFSPTGETVEVAIFEPRSSSQVVTEGTGEDTSMTGLMVPQYDSNGNLMEVVHVSDRLQPINTAKLYEVSVKEGHPNEIDPSLWRIGLSRANSSS